MKLEAGRRYYRRDLSVTRPLERISDLLYPFECGTHTYTETGRHWSLEEGPRDLISEYIEPVSEPDPRDAEIERLKAGCTLREYEKVRIANDTFRARVEELEAERSQDRESYKDLYRDREIIRTSRDVLRLELEELGGYVERQMPEAERAIEERDELKQRVDELEAFANDREAARIKAQVEWKDMKVERDALREQVRRLECLGYTDIYEALSQERDTLKAKVEELENESLNSFMDLKENRRQLNTIAHERDELRAQLEEAKSACKVFMDRAFASETQLAALTQPKLVKSTWQNVFEMVGDCPLHPSRSDADIGGYDMFLGDKRINVLRRDHYTKPDGTTYVEATLEHVDEK